jgi:hypothetical protein
VSHDHLYVNHVSIPRRLLGAVLGYDDYRECKVCARLVPAELLTEADKQRAREYTLLAWVRNGLTMTGQEARDALRLHKVSEDVIGTLMVNAGGYGSGTAWLGDDQFLTVRRHGSDAYIIHIDALVGA